MMPVLDLDTLRKIQAANIPAPVMNTNAPALQTASVPAVNIPPSSATALGQRPPVTLPLPYPMGPAEQNLENLPIPNRADYQAHGLHRVLNAIAGGFAGAAGHPEEGRELAEAPYARAIADYNLQRAARESAAKAEQERVSQGVSAHTADVTAGYRSGMLGIDQEKIDEQTRTHEAQIKEMQQKIDETERAHKATEAARITAEAEKAKADAERYKSNLQYIMALPPEQQGLALDILKRSTEATETGKETVEASPLGAKAASNVTGAKIIASGTPAATEAERKKTEAEQSAKGSWEALSEDEKNTVNTAVDQINADPMSFTDITKGLPTKLKSHVMSKVDAGTSLRTWTADAQGRRSRTSITRNHIQSALDLATNNKVIQDNMGAIMGRALQGQSKLGDMPFLKTDKDKEEAQKFLTLLGNEVGWEAAMLTGGRGGVRMVDFIKSFSPQAKMEYPVFKGAAEGMLKSVDNVLKGLSDPSGIYVNNSGDSKFGFVPGAGGPKVNRPGTDPIKAISRDDVELK